MLGTENVTRKMTSHKLPDGREIVLCSFGAFDWTAVQEESLAYYKRSVIKTWMANIDLLPPEMRNDKIEQAYQKAEKFTVRSLPRQTMQVPETDDNGKEIRNDKDELVMKDVSVDYTSWWISDTMEGRLFCLWLSAHKAPGQEKWTKAQVAEMFDNLQDADYQIDQAASAVGRISRMDEELVKNSSPPPPAMQNQTATEGMTAKQIRMMRRAQRQQQGSTGR